MAIVLDFWKAIGVKRLRDADDVGVALDQVRGRLEGASPLDLTLFAKQLHEYLYRLDRRTFAEVPVVTKAGLLPQSEDFFLYARCACVLAGRDEFDAVIREPNRFEHFARPELQAEGLLYVAGEVYEQATGRRMRIASDFPLEWKSNTDGWSRES